MGIHTTRSARRLTGRPQPGRSATAWALSALLAASLLVSAWVHFWLWFDLGFSGIDVIGPAFVVNAVAGIIIATAVLAWYHWLPMLLAVGFGVSTFGAFVVSATVGLFGVHEPWVGTWQMTANVSEVVSIVVGLVLLLRVGASSAYASSWEDGADRPSSEQR